ncbi:MAG: CHASE2 domain-containing sensor protein [Oleiphilaceae bacterium]|jgi:CHASE2 domain-containing sensor protein
MSALHTFRFDFMNTIKTLLFSFALCIVLSACSSSASDVHQIIEAVDRSSIQGVQLVIEGDDIQLTSQTIGSIFTLHQNAQEVRQLAELVAQQYGFIVVEAKANVELDEAGVQNDNPEIDEQNASFYLNILTAMPDGGACLGGLASAAKNLSYTGSVLTLGLAPASAEHCLIVTAELYKYQDNERVLIGEFNSNLGRVGLYAGANEIDNYQLNVDKRDEIRSLEVSFASLLNTMLAEEAFEQKIIEYF